MKVLWKNQLVGGVSWDSEADMRSRYPHIFRSAPTLSWVISSSWFILSYLCVLAILMFLYTCMFIKTWLWCYDLACGDSFCLCALHWNCHSYWVVSFSPTIHASLSLIQEWMFPKWRYCNTSEVGKLRKESADNSLK